MATTRVERPISSSRFSVIQRGKGPNLGKILDTSAVVLPVDSGAYLVLERGLKIRVLRGSIPPLATIKSIGYAGRGRLHPSRCTPA